MLSNKVKLEDDEQIIYRIKRRKGGIVSSILFLFLGTFIFIACFYKFAEIIIYNKISFEQGAEYLTTSVSMIFFLWFPIINFVGRVFNYILITNKRIYIRKGCYGRLYAINKELVESIQEMEMNIKGSRRNIIKFFLKNGTKLSTGTLYITEENLYELRNNLRFKRRKPGIVTKKSLLRELKCSGLYSTEGRVNKRKNIVFPLICFPTLIISMVMLSMYWAGVNYKYGSQEQVYAYGRITEKQEYTNDGKKGYSITIYNKKDNENYVFDIKEGFYNNLEKNDLIQISGKRGSLKIVYDIRFHKIK